MAATAADGLGWGAPRRFARPLIAIGLALALLTPSAGSQGRTTVEALVDVIVGSVVNVEAHINAVGGEVTRQLPLVDAVSARIPVGALPLLMADPQIRYVVPNRHLEYAALDYDSAGTANSMYNIAQVETGAGAFWQDNVTGWPVGVALVDTGVAPVEGLTIADKVVNAADLSFESQASNLRYLDSYGHGTHMAGIIAGRDDGAPSQPKTGNTSYFLGMAPGAKIINVKVADAKGVTDVSQVISALDWIITHKNDADLNIKVVLLAFATDGDQNYLIDPLAQAAEAAWHAGLVVVVAAGNGGNTSPLRNPAFDPYLIAVGAAEGMSTFTEADDVLQSFSNCGTANRHVDVVAPGKSVISVKSPNSAVDLANPGALVGSRFMKGTGTSQAAAVVAGAAALIVDQRPGITPDQVKALLMNTARPIPGVSETCQGAGIIDLNAAKSASTPSANQNFLTAIGGGLIEEARGHAHVVRDGVSLSGEKDIHGRSWLGNPSWSGGSYNGKTWSGNSWSGNSWSGDAWSGASWSGNSWSGNSWSGASWSGNSWSGNSWSGNSWSGASWSGNSWSSNYWLNSTWG